MPSSVENWPEQSPCCLHACSLPGELWSRLTGPAVGTQPQGKPAVEGTVTCEEFGTVPPVVTYGMTPEGTGADFPAGAFWRRYMYLCDQPLYLVNST
ncbi:hypothetical protein CB1_000334003 [Camelus ferus]|nr:hypothetical protein CB1_000334003 [Camelus ferus]